jgi:hypothetical protein
MCQNHENSGYRARNPFGIRILRVNPSRMKNLEGSQICILLKKGNLLTEYPGGVSSSAFGKHLIRDQGSGIREWGVDGWFVGYFHCAGIGGNDRQRSWVRETGRGDGVLSG